MQKLSIEQKREDEGGCGVIGVAASEKIAGRHLLTPLIQMRNRGNGKGGGVALAGLSPEQFQVTEDILRDDYLIAIAYLDMACRKELEEKFIDSIFHVDSIYVMPSVSDFRMIQGLEVKPPDVYVYFVKVKPNAKKEGPQSEIADELVYRNSDQINRTYYSSTGEKKAFVLSHGKNLLVLKMVGFGDDVIRYYQLEDRLAHVWIGHHRYPTKGKVWHPGGAHPFIGLNEALVHNGDFANYYSLCEYLAERNIHPLFLTDTEVASLIFDLLIRTYRYPLEYVIEAFAPTTERDFSLLPEDKQRIYAEIQKAHIHSSPDGPWFFLIAQSIHSTYRLIGITDTSMLRPQVFALQKGKMNIGFAASEKQAIDAALKSLSDENKDVWSRPDYIWNARGGSYTDGGAFIFSVYPQENKETHFECTDKFGRLIHGEEEKPPFAVFALAQEMRFPDVEADELFAFAKKNMPLWTYEEAGAFLNAVSKTGNERALNVLTRLLDLSYPMGNKRRSCILSLIDKALSRFADSIRKHASLDYAFVSHHAVLKEPSTPNQALVIDAEAYPPEGPDSLAAGIQKAYQMGFRRLLIFHCRGQRFIANGLGANSIAFRIEVYGSSGDYLGSGIDGAQIVVHGNAQDQVGQIMKSGKLIVHGDVGQTFLYGAKGGSAFVKGNAAGRPLINAVGKPRVVINGTCLDYLAESFMAGNPLKDGGFAILNGIECGADGEIRELSTPYPGGNLFSLSSGGAIYIRDPAYAVSKAQLNGGEFVPMTDRDADLILPYLRENELHFDIPISRLLEFEGKTYAIKDIYRKIGPVLVVCNTNF